MELLGNEGGAWIYSFLVIHVFTASSTARVKSPFFPPNLSIVFNLSCFSSWSESSTHIRPIFNRLFFYIFCARFTRVRCFSSKRIARSQVSCLFLLSFFIHLQFAYPHNILCIYTLIRLLVYYLKRLSDKDTIENIKPLESVPDEDLTTYFSLGI